MNHTKGELEISKGKEFGVFKVPSLPGTSRYYACAFLLTGDGVVIKKR